MLSAALVLAPFGVSSDSPFSWSSQAFAKDGGKGGGSGGGKGGGSGKGGGTGQGGGKGAGGPGKSRSAPGAAKRSRPATGVRAARPAIRFVHENRMSEQIDGGRYVMKDAAGRTIVNRAASKDDFARIKRLRRSTK
jgi:hypothetical protein